MATPYGHFVVIHVSTNCMWQSYAPLYSPAAPRMADLGVRGPPMVSVEASARSSKEIWRAGRLGMCKAWSDMDQDVVSHLLEACVCRYT
jgi:hypothetical protein